MKDTKTITTTTCDLCGGNVGEFAFATVTFGYRPVEACGIMLAPKTFGAFGNDVCHACYWRAIKEAAAKEIPHAP